jgi:GNAT superfamily N-acetyltransferase
MIAIRPAIASDAAALAALRWDFRAGRGPTVESREAFVSRCAEWMRRELETSRWRCWVATEAAGRDIVGQVWLQVLTKVPNPVGERDRHAYVSNLYVLPAARGGVGGRLLEAALAWTEGQGIDRVVLWPTPRSVGLYERHGFARVGDVMELKCADSTP